MRSGIERAVVAAGALCGIAGVGLSAAAAHVTGSGSLDISARFLLVHAPALLALAALLRVGLVHRPIAAIAGAALLVGLVLFSGDLAVRALYGVAPIPMAAPVGGVLLILGWLLLAAASVVARPDRAP